MKYKLSAAGLGKSRQVSIKVAAMWTAMMKQVVKMRSAILPRPLFEMLFNERLIIRLISH